MKTAYEDPLTEVYSLFYTACLPLFTNHNLFLQRDDPLAQKVYPMAKELIRKIASCFLKTSCYHGEGIIDEYIIDDADNYLPLDEVFIGFSTRQKLNKLFKGDIDQTQYNTVPKAAIALYRESLRYVLDKMDMSCCF